ncbi:MAG TPA: cupin domain-containing protein [Solirubrobacteraceae bacterium]|nr:cupin domain-containing protein [Solirubrobacteraceae bacterium]
MQQWDLSSLDVEPQRPIVLDSHPEGRSVALTLRSGERLQEHRVHERAWLVVIDGEIEIDAHGTTERSGAGVLAIFDPKEDHEIRALAESRLLVILAPWPGEGRDLDADA